MIQVFDNTRYYCSKCKMMVMPIDGVFEHPHLGTRGGKVCPVCKKPVYIKDLS